jgi:hypothetical protein
VNTFQKYYGYYTGHDIAMGGVELGDGGFLFAGWQGMATRTDKYGTPHWIKRYKYTQLNDVAANGSSLYLLSRDGLIATDMNGDIQWSIKSDGVANSVAVATDGGLVFGGMKNNDFFIVKVDATGTFLWGHIYGGAQEDKLTHIEALSDGFLLVGTTRSFGAQDTDYLVIRTNLNGVIQWAKRMGGADNEGQGVSYSRAIQTQDNGFLLAGYTSGFGAVAMDALAIKLDPNGAVQWATRAGDNDHDNWNAVAEVAGGYVFFGTTRQKGPDMWLSKLDPQGLMLWNRVYGDIYTDGNYVDGGATSDGGLFLVAHSHNFFVDGPGSKSHALLKTDAEGKTPGCCNDVAENIGAVSVIMQSVDVTAQILPQSIAANLPALSVTPEDYTQAFMRTLCEKTVGQLCGGISTGTCDCSE